LLSDKFGNRIVDSFVCPQHDHTSEKDSPMESSPTNPFPADIETLQQELQQIFVGPKADPKENEPTDRDSSAACLVIKGK